MLLPPLFRMSSGQTMKEIYIKEALANYLAGILVLGLVSVQERCASPYHHLIPEDQMVVKTARQWTFFSVRELHKIELASLSVSQESFKTSCDGVIQTITKDVFTDALRWIAAKCAVSAVKTVTSKKIRQSKRLIFFLIFSTCVALVLFYK